MEEYRFIGYVRSMDEAQKYIAGRNCLYGEQELAREFNLGMQVEAWLSGDKFVAFDTQWRRLAEYFGTQKQACSLSTCALLSAKDKRY